MTVPFIGKEQEQHLDWLALADAIEAGHALPKAEVADSFLYRGKDTVLSRVAWIDGLGQLVKTATIYPDNGAHDLPSINGIAAVFNDETGVASAFIDFHLLTKWKTAGDSVCAARRLARPDSDKILIVGAGTVAWSLRAAYGALFPQASFQVWNRTPSKAKVLAEAFPNTIAVLDLEAAVAAADIVTSATMTLDPFLKGAWLRPGQHIDLIGAYRPDMREADDQAMQRARIFVDSRGTTVGHIGEIEGPLQAGVITQEDILADFYDLPSGAFARSDDDDITLFKNGGGAHLDLMTATYILSALP